VGVVGNESAYYVYRVSEMAYIEEYELLEKDFMRIRGFGFKGEVGNGPSGGRFLSKFGQEAWGWNKLGANKLLLL
jgi:hypothetical protein